MWHSNNLRDRDYKSSSSVYKKYAKHVGKLVGCEYWAGKTAENEEGWKVRIYMISAVTPQRHYMNRFAYKLIAVGDHNDCEYGCAGVLKDLLRNKYIAGTDIQMNKKSGWRFLD